MSSRRAACSPTRCMVFVRTNRCPTVRDRCSCKCYKRGVGPPHVAQSRVSSSIRCAAARASSAAVLDFGCGQGEFVALARREGLQAQGCDWYAGPWAWLFDDVKNNPALRDHVRQIEPDGRLPFADASFDAVTSNMVFEHIADFEKPVSEIARVLKPGGAVRRAVSEPRTVVRAACRAAVRASLPVAGIFLARASPRARLAARGPVARGMGRAQRRVDAR